MISWLVCAAVAISQLGRRQKDDPMPGGRGHNARQMMSLGDPVIDWVKLASGLGVEAARADSVRTLDDLVRTGISRQGPFLIEAVL